MTHNAPAPQSAELCGALYINKCKGYTSHDVVQIARRVLNVRKIGHTGTLDPAAEGLLILLVGKATKRQHAMQGHGKVYEAHICLGSQTETGDAEGEVVVEAEVPVLDTERVAAVLDALQGEQVQRVPAYSAVKINGKPAYWWTRRNTPVDLPERTIQLNKLELLGIKETTIHCRVHCTAGTYVRVLAETVAASLGTVGHLAGLVRTRIGSAVLEDAVETEWLKRAERNAVVDKLRPVESLQC